MTNHYNFDCKIKNCILLYLYSLKNIHLFIHLFNQQLFIEYLLCAKHCSRHWAYISQQSRQKETQPCPQGSYILAMGGGMMDYKQLCDK